MGGSSAGENQLFETIDEGWEDAATAHDPRDPQTVDDARFMALALRTILTEEQIRSTHAKFLGIVGEQADLDKVYRRNLLKDELLRLSSLVAPEAEVDPSWQTQKQFSWADLFYSAFDLDRGGGVTLPEFFLAQTELQKSGLEGKIHWLYRGLGYDSDVDKRIPKSTTVLIFALIVFHESESESAPGGLTESSVDDRPVPFEEFSRLCREEDGEAAYFKASAEIANWVGEFGG